MSEPPTEPAGVTTPAAPTTAAGAPRRRRAARGSGTAGIAIGGGVLLTMLLCAFLLPLPYHPTTPDPTSTLLPPSGEHWLGTDVSGFDVFSRVIAAGRRDLPLALGGALLSLVIGAVIGLVISRKGRFGERAMRMLDAFQSFPLIVLSVTIVSFSGNAIQNVIYAIVIINVPRFIRLVRSEALALRETRYIEAAHAIGAHPVRVMYRHMLPNVIDVCLVQMSLAAANAVIVIAALNFLGVGVSPPTPTWGSMIRDGGANVALGQWWIVAAPGVAVFLSVAALNLLADGIQRRFSDD
jgi:peptide/nickel transport system permease protein